MRKKLTGWYPPDVAPIRAGVYRVKVKYGRWYCWIDADGTQWSGGPTPALALIYVKVDPVCTDLRPWRGLAKKPK